MMFSARNVRLHLTPCTVSEYINLGEQERDYYDLVDGLLVAAPKMTDCEHERIVEFICAKAQIYHNSGKDISIDRRGQVYVPSREKYSKADHGGKFDSDTPSSAPDSGRSGQESVREPDVAIGKYRRAEAEKNLSPTSQKIRFSANAGPPLLVFEVTSESNRDVDLNEKWREYRRSGTQEYVIVDRTEKCVIVGTLDGAVERVGRKEASGDPKCTEDGGGCSEMYHRKVYRGSENVKCFIFEEEGEDVTADLLLDPPHGNDILRNAMLRDREKVENENEKISKESRETEEKMMELEKRVASRQGKARHSESQDAEGKKRSKCLSDKRKSGSSDSPPKKKSRGRE